MIGRIAHLLRIQAPVVDNRGLLWGSGATVPTDGTDGWQTGAIWQKTNGGVGTALYINEGSVTSCAFNAVEGLESISIADLVDVADAFATRLLETGTYQSTAGGAVVLSATNTRPFTILTDDGGANLDSGNYRPFLSRTLLTVDQTGSTITPVRGQLKLITGVDVQTGVYAPVQGYVELVGTHSVKTGAHMACIDASLEIGTALTVDSGGKAGGIYVETTGAGTITNNGNCAGILVTKASGAASWPNGVEIDMASCVQGLIFGGTQAEAGKCIDFANVTMLAGSSNNLWSFGDGVAAVEVTITDYWFPARMNVASIANPGAEKLASLFWLTFAVTTAHQANLDVQGLGCTVNLEKNVGYAHAIEGLVDVKASLTTTTGTIIGGKFGVDLSAGATLTHGVGDNLSAVCALVTGTGTYTGGMVASIIEARKESATAIDNGLWINVLTGATVTTAINCGTGAGTITNLLSCKTTNGPAVATVEAGDAGGGSIKILVDGAAKYLHYWNNAS